MKKEIEGLSQIIASLRDQVSLVDKKIEEKVDSSLKKSFVQNVRDVPPHMEHNHGSGQNGGNGQGNSNAMVKSNGNNGGNGNNNANKGANLSCFYCWFLEHYSSNCPYKQEHIDMGYVKFENGVIKLGDGRYIPRYPENKSRKERVDDYWAAQGKRRGSELGRIGNAQSQLLQQGFDPDCDQVNMLYDTRDDELRSMKVQMLNAQIPQQMEPQIMAKPQAMPQQFMQMGGVVPNNAVVANSVTLPAGWDLQQLAQLVEAVKSQSNSNASNQFIQTRTGADRSRKEAGGSNKSGPSVAKPPENRQGATEKVESLAEVSDNWRVKLGDRDDLEERIARIKDWPSPRTYSEVANALGMMNAYRDNIWNFAKHIKPFVDLIKGKGTRSFKWGGDHEGAFLELKNMIVLMLRRHMKDEPEERASGEKQPEKVRNREVEIKIDLDDDYSDGEQQPYQVKYDKMLAVKGKPERPRPPKEPIPMPDEQNYRVVPKLNKSETVKKVAKRILGGNFEMSAEEMATVSPEVARELKAQITKSRQPLDKGTVLAQNVENILPGDCLEEEETLRYDALDINELPKVSIFTLSSGDFINVPAGSLIAPDPYEIYLSTLGSNEEKKQVFMALNQLKSFGIDSGPIKCLFPLVNEAGFSDVFEELGINRPQGDLALKFGFDNNGELQIEGYLEPRDGKDFSTDELNTAYLQASTNSKSLKEDVKATTLLQEFVKPKPKQEHKDGDRSYQVFTFDERLPEHCGVRPVKPPKKEAKAGKSNRGKHTNDPDLWIGYILNRPILKIRGRPKLKISS
ncbi:hypothetical protein C8R47DRAFT_1082542 [Mycena vitilis]|nr:hypothetical protein C8R47DRAFT_1082542 [Mycena vitilis]